MRHAATNGGREAPISPDQDKARGLGRWIADRIRRDILTGRLAPGAPVKERDTAMDLGVSRTPTREAIGMLADEGLVVLRPARSPVVADPTLKEVTDALQVLIALERLSGRLACAAATEADLAAIREANGRMAAAYSDAYTLDLFEMDMAFHQALVAAARNPSLQRTHQAYLGRLWRARYLSASQRRNRSRVVSEHGAIIAALAARDPDAVEAAIDRHLDHLVKRIDEVYDDTGSRARGPAGR
jgi:DNA-binding GntR family transcriptional regulator